MEDDFTKFLPLLPAQVYVLLALAGGDMRGSCIMREIARQSEGAYLLGQGAVYGNLKRLMDQGMVQDVANVDPRQRIYLLSSRGRKLLEAEVLRMEELVWEARLRLGESSRHESFTSY